MKPALACLALFACAPTYPATEWSDGIPPERYQSPTLTTVAFLPAQEVSIVCGKGKTPPPGMTIVACANSKLAILPDPCPLAASEWYARIACHELAHVQGWPGDHPE